MHPEADAFLDAIFDNPDDDTPRLIYADWLTEHGHEDYAQFIRLSCKIRWEVLTHDERTRLRRGRFELWRRMDESGGGLLKTLGLSTVALERGVWPRDIELKTTAGVFATTSDRWLPVVCPQRLRLQDTNGFEVVVARCEYLRRVTRLRCAGAYLGVGTDRLGDDCGVYEPLGGEFVRLLVARADALPCLTELDVDSIALSAAALRTFSLAPLAASLDHLRLNIRLADGTDAELNDGHKWRWHPHPDIYTAVEDFIREYGARMLD